MKEHSGKEEVDRDMKANLSLSPSFAKGQMGSKLISTNFRTSHKPEEEDNI